MTHRVTPRHRPDRQPARNASAFFLLVLAFAIGFPLTVAPALADTQETASQDKPAEAKQDKSVEDKAKPSSAGEPKDDKKSNSKNADGKNADKAKAKAEKPSGKSSNESDKKADKKDDPAKGTNKPPQPDAQWVKKGAFTEPPVDSPFAEDFKLMGEFVGKVTGEDGKPRTMGLQLRVLGKGQFEARTHTGGLPGQDGYDQETRVLIGRRSGDALVLSGAADAYFVTPEKCVIVGADGKQQGELARADRHSPTLGAAPPEVADVIFRGKDTPQLTDAEMTDDGFLKPGTNIIPLYTDFDLHVEFRVPFMPAADGQSRGNSGLYLQSRYECQVLDSFGGPKVFNGLGALYRQKAAKFNMALPPLAWQTYDIRFTAPRFNADGSKRRKARLTAWVNGVKVQDDVEVSTKTGHGQQEGPEPLPIKLQDHHDPVRYRNIWIIDRGLHPGIDFPLDAAAANTDEDEKE